MHPAEFRAYPDLDEGEYPQSALRQHDPPGSGAPWPARAGETFALSRHRSGHPAREPVRE